MFLKKLLIWCVSIVWLSSCVNTYNKEVFDSIYVDKINDINGIMLRDELLTFFSNNNLEDAKYILRSNLKLQEDLELLNQYGLATQGNISITFTYSIQEIATKEIILSGSKVFSETYPMGKNAHESRKNKLRAINTINKNIAQYVLYDIYSFIRIVQTKKDGLINNESSSKSS
jgi:hypothetical protein